LDDGGALILGFEQLRNLTAGVHIKRSGGAELVKFFEDALLVKPDLLFIDEGHRIKNPKAGLGQV
jgi:Holliday junction resolvasome RuvABC ATP-dependent DNA helicase subunit